MSLHEITKRANRPNRSLILPAADAARGVAFQESSTSGTAELADGTLPIVGFVTRQTLITGPVLGDSIYPGRIELPFTGGQEGSFEYGEELEAEGSTYLDAAITAGTALKSRLSFVAGKFKVAVTGQYSEFILVAKPTPEVVGNVRIRVQKIEGVLIP